MRLERDLVDILDAVAERGAYDRSAVIRLALVEYLRGHAELGETIVGFLNRRSRVRLTPGAPTEFAPLDRSPHPSDLPSRRITTAPAPTPAIRGELPRKIPRTGTTFASYALGAWITQADPFLAHATRLAYRTHLARWAPHLGGSLRDLDAAALERAVAALAAHYSATQVRIGLGLVRRVLLDAVRDGHRTEGVSGRIRLPRIAQRDPDDPNALTTTELAHVLRELEGGPWHALACTLALTGLRWGTVTALRWGDVDHAAGVLHVRRSQYLGVEKAGEKTGRKTRLPLPRALADVLRRPEGARDVDLVFPARGGGLRRSNVLRKPLNEALARAGITKRFTVHGFRRTWVSRARLLADGITQRSIVGHADEAMTERYAWVDEGQQRALLDAMSAGLGILPAAGPAGEAPVDAVAGVHVDERRIEAQAAEGRQQAGLVAAEDLGMEFGR